MRTRVRYEVGFSDGEVRYYFREEGAFTVVVEAWNGALVRVAFDDPAGVCDTGVGDISDICVEDAGSPFMSRVLGELYEVAPASHPYRLYQFLNLDEQPALEVVAAGITISPFGPPSRAPGVDDEREG